MQAIDQINDGLSYIEAWPPAYALQSEIEAVFNQSVYAGTLRSSRRPADELLAALRVFTNEADLGATVKRADVFNVHAKRDHFRIAFLAELEVIPAYFVTQKEGYDTGTLLEDGLRLFPSTIFNKVPEAVFDAGEAAKALAFELPSACGFHAFRVLEAVLRRYHAEVTGGKAPPKVRTIGTYIRSMRNAKCGDEKILTALEHIRDLHRNPLIHPTARLDMEEAVSLLGIVRSVVGFMLNSLTFVPLTTTTVISPSGASPQSEPTQGLPA